MSYRTAAVALLAFGLTTSGVAYAGASDTEIQLTVTPNQSNGRITGDNQGFSVESADFAHGYLTKQRMAQRLRTLGPGVLRLGGYSMDLVWPSFGAAKGTPAPDWAIGGTVDRSDFEQLKQLVRASGWKVTLGAPLKSVLDGQVTMDQVVEEVAVAHEVLGDDLLSVEMGNEYDHVTTLTPAQYWEKLKEYQAAIQARLPKAKIRMSGPSANTAKTNTQLDGFATAALADPVVKPSDVLGEISSHWYPGSHCGTSNLTIPQLMSAATSTTTEAKLAGIESIGERFLKPIPMTINESNSASCSGQPGVSTSYATSLWSLDYLLQTARSGISRLQFHTNTAAICGDFKPRASPDYPISYRYYGAFCAADQAALDRGDLSATPLYYGIWAFRQVPQGRFVTLDVAAADLGKLRAYGIEGRHGELTVVLINVQDPAAADGTTDKVSLALSADYRHGRQVTLRSTAPEGLASSDPSTITLGGQQIRPDGKATGTPHAQALNPHGRALTAEIPAGTAQLITLTR
ncbi:hypothetical protein F1D05_37670 [Kribbella qitaiheensis]|uniref:Beta-glucuronidase C-terminal domain-containing protein n=1 Tax=Kribbella qitaiheensis TaxID=1544730 RepID=A0A7G6X8M0_9ACTN|nr:hypothetical protein [Kribbella qitaiheensis]QNE22585.1 hypothetical protein F1D05_37670 [Kribbella qitaiheensis]